MSFIHEDFLLHSKSARHLYHTYAEGQPILDYHCHLPAAEIADNRRFADLATIWLEGDHYKWRAMRANGIAERFCTGDAAPYEKFLAWAQTVPRTLRNPLYHWTHLELKRYFGIDELLDETTSSSVWQRAHEELQKEELRAQGILKKFDVRVLCTTDDPVDSLSPHESIVESGLKTRVYPTFRPDRALDVHLPERLNEWIDRLTKISNVEISKLHDLLHALRKRHDAFHAIGGRLSDHGLQQCYADFCSERTAAEIFAKARAGTAANEEEQRQFATYLMVFFGCLDSEKGWTKQLHLGARRDVSTLGLKSLGPNTGYDSMGDWPQIDALGAYLDRLEQENSLPKIVLYNVNPVDNYSFATMAGNFQSGGPPGKIQFGSGWWFLDQKEGMEWQINALSNAGLLSRFIGMLTDSRSFMSYPRHEYFRRVLCNLLGSDIERGEIPDREELVGGMIRDICFGNASRYLGLELPESL